MNQPNHRLTVNLTKGEIQAVRKRISSVTLGEFTSLTEFEGFLKIFRALQQKEELFQAEEEANAHT